MVKNQQGSNMNSSMNYVSDILDEIALEGLDGVSLDALWKRLSVRPNFCFKVDDSSKQFIWHICTKLEDLKFYEIPESRKKLKYYDLQNIQNEYQEANIELDTIYPYSSIKSESGIFGSCQDYLKRKDVTEAVSSLTYTAVEKIYADKLVIVASQECRNLSLLGRNCPPNLDFSKCRVQYDILERIGRCRSLGIPTHGKGSLQTVVEDSKSIFYYLKFLIKHKIVKKQSLIGSLKAYPNGSKIYLTRYFGEFMNEYQLILLTAIEELKCRPNYRMTYEEFYQLFDPDKKARVKRFSKTSTFRKYIMISKPLPYREFFPNATQAEWERKCRFGEKTVRCFQLLDPNTEVADVFEKECESDEEEMSSDFLTTETYYKGLPLVHQTYHHVKNSGSHGISIRELSEKMGLTRSFIRLLLKRLIQDNHCKWFEEITGRRHVQRYIVGESAKHMAAASEIFRILSEKTVSVNDKVSPENAGNETVESSGEKKMEADLEVVSAEKEKKIEYQSLEGENVPYRTLRRIGMIIKTIKTHRYRLFFQILRYIMEEEVKEGLTATVCRASVNRILQKLEKDGLIKIVDIGQKDVKNALSIKIYMEPTFVLDEKLTEKLLHAHSTYKSVDLSRSMEEENVQLERQLSEVLLENLTEMKKMLMNIKFKNDKNNTKEAKERELSHSPKFVRLNIIHELMYYLVYDYTGITDKSQEELLKELSKTCEIDDDLRNDMPKIYATQLSSYLFIPPLNCREGISGWFLVSDLLIRLPLSIFVKILRVNDTTPELISYLNHPIRRHFLIKDLPFSIRQTLFHRLQFLVTFSSDIKRLCFLGLIQFGVKCGKEQYQTLLYLNRNASLLDTTSSPPAYLYLPADVKFPVNHYRFNTRQDIKKYWQEMCHICLGTNLGEKKNMIGKEILAVREMGKESLRKVAEPKTTSKVLMDDNGTLPGDHLGAGGIDSVMFSFLRSNWMGPVTKTKEQVKPSAMTKMPLQKLKKELAKKKQRLHLKKSRLKKLMKNPEVVLPKPIIAESAFRFGSNRTRKVKEREVKIKRVKKTYYDEVDIEALKLKNTLRVTWSAAEDHFLLICQVAIMYLSPNPRVFVRIPWSEVRCNLQKNLVESRDKTQKAIARRVKYMMKNPTTRRSVSLCLEELSQVPEVSERFDCRELIKEIKPSSPNSTEIQTQLNKKFHELVDYMREKFSKGASFSVREDEEEDLIPDELEDFKNIYQFETVPPKEELSVKNIRESVIRAILMSSLSCRSDKTSSAIQLFEIYRQYEDDELQNAIKKLNSDKVVTVRKPNHSIFKKGRYLPLSQAPCKLSFSFQNLLNVKYSHNLYSDSYGVISKLRQCEDADGFCVDLNECNIPLFVLGCMDLVSFRTTVPDQIIVLDSGNSMDNDAYARMLKRYCEMLQFSQSDSKLVCTSGKLLTTVPETFPETETEKKEESEAPKDSLEAEKSGSGSWRIVLYMMREEAKKEINNFTGNRAQEFFVVNASQVHCSRSNELEYYAKEMDQRVVHALVRNIINRYSVPLSLVSEDSVYEEFRNKDSNDESLKMLKKVLEFIYQKREFGSTNEELRSNFNEEFLPRIIRHLTETKIVIRTGLKETRYVGQKYCTPWLLNSFRITRLEREKIKPSELSAVELTDECGDEDGPNPAKKRKKGVISSEDLKSEEYTPPSCSVEANNKVKMIIRPWIRIDGSLNRKVMDRFLGTMLGYIMMNPGITVKAVMDKFSPSLLPIWTKDLVEILHSIGCVSFTTYILKKKATLFQEEEVVCMDGFTGLDDDESVVVEAKIDAITTLGLFIGKRSYSRDFLTD